MELYTTLESILISPTPTQKIELFTVFYAAYLRGDITREASSPILIFSQPSYRDFCTVIDPKEIVRRPKLGGVRGQIQLLHSIAHIEYSAIDLALDAVYRFRDVGDEFNDDWLKVAHDEVRHFLMIDTLLHEFGSFYGEYPVHDGLFEASVNTTGLLERMAVVPRYLEANGLDATPLILTKLEPFKRDPMVVKIIQALQIILDEEIDHVYRGDRWFKVACERENIHPDVYFEIIERHYPSSFPRKVGVNCEGRVAAGFGPDELNRISLVKC
ncbi:MAG TPA: ferritin-like domain-containing protein [Sulfuricurvum sp.]|nr:ferritin-like domain-containing protein [Sulfuricurvum sp.]